VPPVLLGGSAYVPLRFPAEAFGGTVRWDGLTKTAFIYLAGFVALFIAGPGRYSFDHYILRAFRGDQ